MIPAPEVADPVLDEPTTAGVPPRPAADEPGQPVRLLPIAGLAGFVALTVVLARLSSRLADIAGVVLFGAALAWLVWPVATRLKRSIGTTGSLVVVITTSLALGLGVGTMLLTDLTTGARAVSLRLTDALAGGGDNSIFARMQRSVRLGDGVGEWMTSLPNTVLFGSSGAPAVGHRVADLLVVIVLAAFFLVSGPGLVAAVVAWWPRPERARVWALLGDIDQRAGGYLRRVAIVGFVSSTVIAVAAFIGGASMPVALGLWAGFWFTVPVVGWVVGLAPLLLASSYMDPLPGVVLALAGVGAAAGVHALRRHDHRSSQRARPGSGVVVLCVAVGVAMSGSATAILTLIFGVVGIAAVTSEHRSVRLPSPQVGEHPTYRIGPVVFPGGWRGAIFAAGVVVVSVVAWTVTARAAQALVWIVIAALLAIAIERPVQFVARTLHVPRAAALTVTFAVMGALTVALVASALSEGPTSAARALQRLPGVVADLEEAPVIGGFLKDRALADTIGDTLEQLPSRLSTSRGALAWFPSIGSQLVDALWVLMLTIALAIDGRRIVAGLTRRVSAKHRRQVVRMTAVSQNALAGYAAGAVLVSAMNGTVVLVLALVLKIGLAPLLALWAFLWDFIPQIGGVIGGLPLLLLSLVAGPTAFLIATSVYLVYQIIESNVIFPKIIGDSVDIAPWATMVAALAGAAAGGVVGAIVLTPLVGVVRTAILEYRRGDFPGRTAALPSDDPAMATRG